jgi:serine/threonine protein kinase/tetratricopeptide (TPR) repeat protein
MQAERWRQIDEIFHSALNVVESRRAAFIDEACSGDEDLRLELERLLLRHQDADSFLESPALEVAAEALAPESDESGAALVGQTVSHYRILSQIGSGGMGVVYKAEDIRLGRAVALKFLPEDMARDPRSLQRFEREARAASSLNHANICTIYEVEEHDRQPVIVMELLQGQSLKQRMREGPIPADDLLDFGIQMSDALEAAHAKGIIHRDVKPANIFIVANGQLKILDFGLAKVIPADAAENQNVDAETITLQGAIAGTTAYMSPEQATGEEIDARSDLFSLGVVLYELATVQHPFARNNTVLTIDAILNVRPPAATSLNPALPAGLETIIARMLEKDRELRYQHAAEIRADLQRLKSGAMTVFAKRSKVIVSAAAAVLALSVAGYFYFHRAPKLTDKDTIVLADFINKTGDPVFDGTLRQGLEVQLEQSPFLRLVSDQRIHATLGLMGQPADAPLTATVSKEICERAGGAAVLEGSIASLGSQYVLGLRAKNCRTGEVLDDQQAQVAKKEDVLNALSQIAGRFRSRIGESLATVAKHDTPLAEATTPSLEALKAYSTALKLWFSTGQSAAIPHLQRAIGMDPQFAMAHATLGRMHGELWDPVLAAESARKAYQLRNRVSDPERFFIMVPHDLDVTGNLESARQTAEVWAETYPRDVRPHGYLSWIYQELGKYDKSIAEGNRAIDLEPDFPFGYVNLAWSYVQLGRLPEAENTLRRASEHKVAFPEFLIMRYYIASLRGDQAGMKREAALAEANPDVGDWAFHAEASVLAYSGHLQEARRKSRQAVDLAQQTAHKRESAATYDAAAAVREAFFGNARAARRYAAAALDLSKGRDVEYGAAFALALSADTARSQAIAKDLEKRAEDTYVRFTYLPTLRALWSLSHGDSSNAIELLQIAAPYELAVSGSGSGIFGNLYAVYLRGQACLLAHRGLEAAAQFQKILDHRGVVFADPVGVMARLQLARAFAMSGDSAKAKAAYQEFLTLWKDADAGVPILKQAKTEYAKLK